MEPWHDFYLTAGGAAATLTGLLFVALSVNKNSIGQNPKYRSLARQTVLALMSIVVLALIALIPDQPRWVFGLELAGGALVNLILSGWVQWRTVQQSIHGKPRYLAGATVYNGALCFAIAGGLGQWSGWANSLILLVPAILGMGSLAVVNCWELVMYVDSPLPAHRSRHEP